MTSDRTSQTDDRAASVAPPDDRPPGKWNVPNVLSGIRLLGSPVLVYLAWQNDSVAFAWLLGGLLLTDWIDGKLAILLKQQTTFGARLDSFADVAMYAALLFGMGWLKGGLIRQEIVWIVAAVASYALSTAIGLLKFRRVPSYHTRAAKTCWLLVGLAALAVFADWSVWPLRITMCAVVLTNIEAMLITLVLPQWVADVTSIYHALHRDRRE